MRGRVNGLISFCIPMSMEVTAGKNQVSHFGKLYNLLANRIASNVVGSADGIDEAYCYLLGKNRPAD